VQLRAIITRRHKQNIENQQVTNHKVIRKLDNEKPTCPDEHGTLMDKHWKVKTFELRRF
jgi:hypothetical protein